MRLARKTQVVAKHPVAKPPVAKPPAAKSIAVARSLRKDRSKPQLRNEPQPQASPGEEMVFYMAKPRPFFQDRAFVERPVSENQQELP